MSKLLTSIAIAVFGAALTLSLVVGLLGWVFLPFVLIAKITGWF